MQATVVTEIFLPASLFLIMLGMGFGLTAGDFGNVLRVPKAFGIGVVCQMLMLPAVGYALVKFFALPPELAVGLFVIALCPGGTTSNMITYLSRGDLALSVALTAVVSILTPFTIPFLLNAAMVDLMGEGEAIVLPLGATIANLLVITVVPVAIGMFVRSRAPWVAFRVERPVKVFSIAFLVLIVAFNIYANRDNILSFVAQAGVPTLVLNVLTMALAFGIASLTRLPRPHRITIGVEVGIQNATTAFLITGTLLERPTMAIPPAVYSVIMFGTAALFGYLVNLRRTDVPAEVPNVAS